MPSDTERKPTNPVLHFNGTAQPITLRDLFAAFALAGFLARNARTYLAHDDAEYCYGVADAMLSEREKESTDAD